MPLYVYKARTVPGGDLKSGDDGREYADVVGQLRRRRLVVVRVEQKPKADQGLGGKIKTQDIVLFTVSSRR